MSESFTYNEELTSDPTTSDLLAFRKAEFWHTVRGLVTFTWLLLIIPVTYLVWSAALGRAL
jgi:hypothetical protein